MKDTPLVSILVPVYNVENYLAECLDSLCGQTLKNIEIVCVNDGSTDESARVLDEYAKKDGRIKVVNKPNGGLPSARNAGLNHATGEYVGFVDSDDYVDKTMFKKMYAKAKKANADIVVCGGHPFPNEDQAHNWLKKILSPRNVVYKSNALKSLFDEPGAQPFLWRNLVRRELIESNNLRLDEKIVLGEDVAFQFKIFSKAKCVAFMSDKFYYYRYARPNSIMNDSKFADYGGRILKHVSMLENTLQTLKSSNNFGPERAARYFNWATNFIYWDFIKVSAADRAKIATKMKDLFLTNNFYGCAQNLWPKTIEHFDFITKFCDKTLADPVVSFVIVSNGNADYTDKLLKSITSQTFGQIEILFYENGSAPAVHKIANQYLHSFDGFCLRSDEWTPVCERYNDAIKTAKGKYIAFLDPLCCLASETVVADIISKFDDPSISLVGTKPATFGKKSREECQLASFGDFVYSLDIIRKNNLSFNDHSFLTGSVFFTKYCLCSQNVYFAENFVQKSNRLRRASIWKEEARALLEAFVYLLEAANSHGLDKLLERVSNLLNSENYVRLVCDATYAFEVSKDAIETQDFHSEAFKLLLKANSLARFSKNDSAMSKMLSTFILNKHKFLEQF